MRCYYPFLLLASLLPCYAQAQSYTDSIAGYRQHYKEEFITDSHSPLKAADTGYLRFYTPDPNYRLNADLTITGNTLPFQMLTHSGKKKNYRQYGIIIFYLHDTLCTLHVYQSIDLIAKDAAKFKDYLFIPFTDETNYSETFGGGRYIDLSIQDITNGKLLLDFNKCYNMYCAYAGGYSCPIPPKENDLKVAIKAGEKLFGKPVKE